MQVAALRRRLVMPAQPGKGVDVVQKRKLIEVALPLEAINRESGQVPWGGVSVILRFGG